MLDFDFNKNCYGCGACLNVCPKNAIKLVENENGFLNPVIDKDKCINCGLCEKKCIYLKQIKGSNKICQCYALQAKKELDKSTSGGAFYQVAKEFIKDGGYVCGCVFDDNFDIKHILTNELEMLKKMRGSKYVQSDTKNCYKEIKKILHDNNKVLFSGTPCQVAALKQIVDKKDLDNLYTISLICEGVASRKVWKDYKGYMENKYNSKICGVNFREKGKWGWNRPLVHYKFKNGKEHKTLSYNLEPYVVGFVVGLYMNNTCYSCQYKYENNISDMIIGDYWQVDEEKVKIKAKNGISALIVNSEKGQKLLDMAKKNVILSPTTFEDIKKGNTNLIKPIPYNQKRESFFKNYDKDKIFKYISKYCSLNSPKKIILKVLYKTNLLPK